MAMPNPTIKETITRIEERLATNEGISAEKKAELLSLIAELEGEVCLPCKDPCRRRAQHCRLHRNIGPRSHAYRKEFRTS